VSRKRIVQLLTSLAVFSCMVLPVQAAPQVNIVPLVQLLLLSPQAETEVVSSGIWDGVNFAPKTDFLTTDEKVCFFGEYHVSAKSAYSVRVAWFRDDIFYHKSWESNHSAGSLTFTPDFCILIAGDPTETPPLAAPTPSPNWEVKFIVDGIDIDIQHFTITEAP